MSNTIVVTGANGDIGREVVEQAVAAGHTVIATVRNEAHIETFAASDLLKFVIMHTDNPDSVKQGFEEIAKLSGATAPDAIIHCAAIERPSTVENLTPEALETIIRVNTGGSLSVMQQAMQQLRGTGGNLVLASSLWGRVSAPLVGPYAATKWALEALTDSARRETRGMGFSIVLANIGAVKSRMLDSHVEEMMDKLENSDETEKRLYGSLYDSHTKLIRTANKTAITADKVAQRLLKIAFSKNPKPRYRIGTDALLLCFLTWLLPTRVMDGILGGPKYKS